MPEALVDIDHLRAKNQGWQVKAVLGKEHGSSH